MGRYHLTCRHGSPSRDSFLPGTTVTMTLDQCNVDVSLADNDVHAGTNPLDDVIDTGVPGNSKVSAVDGRA